MARVVVWVFQTPTPGVMQVCRGAQTPQTHAHTSERARASEVAHLKVLARPRHQQRLEGVEAGQQAPAGNLVPVHLDDRAQRMLAGLEKVVLPDFLQELGQHHLHLRDLGRLHRHRGEAQHEMLAAARHNKGGQAHEAAVVRGGVDADPDGSPVVQLGLAEERRQLADRVEQLVGEVRRGLVCKGHDSVSDAPAHERARARERTPWSTP
jgi:hypothetical protein